MMLSYVGRDIGLMDVWVLAQPSKEAQRSLEILFQSFQHIGVYGGHGQCVRNTPTQLTPFFHI